MGWTPRTCMKLTLAKELGKSHWHGRLLLPEKAPPIMMKLHNIFHPWKSLKKKAKFTGMLKMNASRMIGHSTSSNWKPAYLRKFYDWVVFSYVLLPSPKERSLPGGKSEEVSCKQAGPTWSFILAGEASSMMAKSLSNAAAFSYEGCTMTEEILMSCSWPSIWSKWCSPSRTYQ